ncbi:MAG: hypothetical protein OEL87_02940, partial [Nanoarchaeota archaeon]|nr:hypothetical protein [Nanoarchaeota archaeon]
MVRAGLFNKVVICLLALVYLSSFVAASEISFETSQKDYYFLVGEDAVINLSVNNDYGRDIPGLFMYTIKESISNAGSVSTSQNSQSASFSFGNGISNLGIRLGTKQIPTDIGLSFKFSFEGKQVSLSGINAHFVANKDDKKNKQNKQSSSEQQ